MARNYLHTMFSDGARALQVKDGSRGSYARMEAGADGSPDLLGEAEEAFIADRDSFYLSSVTPGGWPYIQHRGGPHGFLRVLGGNRIGFADYRGNRQHITAANVGTDPRVALFLMDYPNRRRLKLIGQARLVWHDEDPVLLEQLTLPGHPATAGRGWLIDVVGFDWNCPQFITPRFTEGEIKRGVQPLLDELEQLRGEVAHLRAQSSEGA